MGMPRSEAKPLLLAISLVLLSHYELSGSKATVFMRNLTRLTVQKFARLFGLGTAGRACDRFQLIGCEFREHTAGCTAQKANDGQCCSILQLALFPLVA
jgi:hypothetical protein